MGFQRSKSMHNASLGSWVGWNTPHLDPHSLQLLYRLMTMIHPMMAVASGRAATLDASPMFYAEIEW
jgi:hypothetical protein